MIGGRKIEKGYTNRDLYLTDSPTRYRKGDYFDLAETLTDDNTDGFLVPSGTPLDIMQYGKDFPDSTLIHSDEAIVEATWRVNNEDEFWRIVKTAKLWDVADNSIYLHEIRMRKIVRQCFIKIKDFNVKE